MQTVEFDPYHVWLGIPPHEQPPNHYRLLGVELFEGQPDVIAMAADRQMGHLRKFQAGANSKLSQKLLNEVATAKVCLLNPDKKAAYDEQLQQPSESSWAQPVPAEEPAPTPADTSQWDAGTADLSFLSDREGDSARAGAIAYRARKRAGGPGLIIATAVAGIVVIAAFLAWKSPRQADKPGDRTASAAGQGRQPVAPPEARSRQSEAHARKPTGQKNDLPAANASEESGKAKPEPVEPSSPVDGSPSEEPTVAESVALTRPVFDASTATPAPAKMEMPSFQASIDKAADKPSEQPVKKRLPVPDDGVQDQIASQLVGIHDPGRAKTPAEKIKLAYQLLQAAKASKEPNEQYVLLGQGRDLAGQAGDLALVLHVIEATAADFDIDPLDERHKALLAFGEKASNAEQFRTLYGASQRVIGQSLTAGRYELATELAVGVYRTCQRSKEYRKKALDQRDWVQEYCRRQEQRREAEAKLKDNPEDADAHLVLGRHFCLDDDWKQGLPHLAKGSDSQLRQLAEQELAPPKAPADQAKLADAWWTLGKAIQGGERDVVLLRAGYWYDRAHAKLTSGLERLKVEKRLEELVEVRQRRATAIRLAQPGKDATNDLWNDLF